MLYKKETITKWRNAHREEYNEQQRIYQRKQYHETEFGAVKSKRNLARYHTAKEFEKFMKILIGDLCNIL